MKRSSPSWRRLMLAALSLLAISSLGACEALGAADRWVFKLLDPGPFDPALTPPAPDYHLPGAWAALPTTEDGADRFIEALPAGDQESAPADVFYVHPTTWMGKTWNVPIDDPDVMEATTRGGTLIQASAFNACCAVYAPRYRQANGRAFVTPDADGARAIEIAYQDVSAAFDVFLERTGSRPFIVASHSQGTILATRLVRERIAGDALAARLVAAYLIGGPVRAETVGGLPTCAAADQTGCVVAWNARGPNFQPNALEFDAADPGTMDGRICVNPLSWDDPGAHIGPEGHGGALFLDTPEPALKPAFADAQCVDGRLIIRTLGDTERDRMSRILLWLMGPENYHPMEYQLFYADLRANAAQRVEAFIRRSARAQPSAEP